MKVVVVESPSKAKTINKYLGKDYHVLASFGHVRDLPSKNGSVDPENNFNMIWEMDERSEKHIKDITKAVKNAEHLYLATDPDREGEAISWHVQEVLKNKKVLSSIGVDRVVFHEVTKRAVLESLNNPRPLDQNLIEAYLARRALDYLVGFTLSPILWKKLPGSRSAGRVQSVALRLVAEREKEIESFISQEYWSILGDFTGQPSKKLQAKLSHYDKQKLTKFSIENEKQAKSIVELIKGQDYTVQSVEKKKTKRNPAPPFITSTLQQEASRKLRFSARKTMQVAQKLYEGISIDGETIGLITYMRTDSVNIAQEALDNTREFIKGHYGDQYHPDKPRVFKGKAKNAQEAHEAIRPTNVKFIPSEIKNSLEPDQFKLYDLIWKRMVASQMEQAIFDKVTADITNADQSVIFRANGSTLAFDGFLKVYEEGRDDEQQDDDGILPPLAEGEILDLSKVHSNQHFTQPPPRYSEASLVKKMEELGIGRPSTYATIMSTLVDRKYVKIEKRQLIPESLGRVVTSFLTQYFQKYVEYDFTAGLEEQLDEISQGKLDWEKVLTEFWKAFNTAIDGAQDLKISEVLDKIDEDLEAFVFPKREDGKDIRACQSCDDGKLSLKLGKFGAFIGCSNYPECQYTKQLSSKSDGDEENVEIEKFETIVLGQDPKSEEEITLRKGPYGFYLQWGVGTTQGKKKVKPKRVSIPKGKDPQSVTLEEAISMGALPRVVGTHPESGEEIQANRGRYGPYVLHQKKFVSIPKDEDPTTISLDRAIELIKQAADKPKKAAPKKAPAKKTTTKKTPKKASPKK